MKTFFSEKKISFGEIWTFSTPRRLAILVKEVAMKQDSREIEILGPSTKASEIDLKGFAEAHGISEKDLKAKETKRGEVFYFVKTEPGRPVSLLLKDFLPVMIQKMEFPKTMWWEKSRIRFVRPIRWIVALFGENPIRIEVAGVRSGRKSFGHRFLHPKPFLLKDPGQYVKTLERKGVCADRMKRREKVIEEIEKKTKKVKGRPLLDEELLDEVTDLVEFPISLLGRFDSDYLGLPRDVIITAMESHQRYFAVLNAHGNLLPFFVAILNIEDKELEPIRKGNEAVLSARLADARFYWEEDRKQRLEEMVEGLKGVVWQENLGSLYQKTQRVMQVSGEVASELEGVDLEVLLRSAYLAKADLLSSMIRDGKEFTRLEGVMGREYALASGEDPRVAQAIYEHILPRFSGDELPKSLEGALLSIVDKMDTIVGSFLNGKVPTGSEDPLGLRRLGNGIVEILMKREIHLSLKDLFYHTANNLHKDFHAFIQKKDPSLFSSFFSRSTLFESKLWENFKTFSEQRARGFLLEKGMRYDIADAVLGSGFEDIADVKKRAEALMKLRKSQDFERVVIGQKRVANILKGEPPPPPLRESLLKERAERNLFLSTREVEKPFTQSLTHRNYDRSLQILLTLRKPIDDLFDEVMVMVPENEIRNNRLALVKFIADHFRKVADFSKIVIEGEG